MDDVNFNVLTDLELVALAGEFGLPLKFTNGVLDRKDAIAKMEGQCAECDKPKSRSTVIYKTGARKGVVVEVGNKKADADCLPCQQKK